MPYSVEIRETNVVDSTNGESGSPTYLLERRFSTIIQAEEAGNLEFERLSAKKIRISYNILDEDGHAVGRIENKK